MRYPISIQTFETIINGNYVYVDKTDLVYSLAQAHVCFLSRPRRFGKSLLITTLDAYFSGRKDLFKGLKMEALEQQWDVYPIFRIDFAKGRFDVEHGLQKILEEYVGAWEEVYGKSGIYTTLSSRFQYVLEQAAAKTGHKCVILIDEYDVPVAKASANGYYKEMLEVMKSLLQVLKDNTALRFAVITGCLKIAKESIFTGTNNFVSDTITASRLNEYFGFVQSEVDELLKAAGLQKYAESMV